MYCKLSCSTWVYTDNKIKTKTTKIASDPKGVFTIILLNQLIQRAIYLRRSHFSFQHEMALQHKFIPRDCLSSHTELSEVPSF